MNLDQFLLKNIQQYVSDLEIEDLNIPIVDSINTIVNPKINLDYVNDDIIKSLQNDGIYKFGNILNNKICDDILNYLSSKKVDTKNYKGISSEFAKSKNEKFANYEEDVVYSNPIFHLIANNPLILNTVTRYFGCLPTIQYMMCRWTYSFDNDKNPVRSQLFHHDYHGVKFLKLFIYLTDVNDINESHVFVKGSHDNVKNEYCIKQYQKRNNFNQEVINDWYKKKKKRGEHKLKDNTIHEIFHESKIDNVLGSKGFCFIEDTNGMHKGNVPNQDRLFFSITYTLYDSYKDAKPVKKYPNILNLLNKEYKNTIELDQLKYINRFIL